MQYALVLGGSSTLNLIQTFSDYILTEIARYIEFFYTSSGWFDCTEPSPTTFLQGIHDKTVKVWDGSNRVCCHTFKEHSDQVVLMPWESANSSTCCNETTLYEILHVEPIPSPVYIYMCGVWPTTALAV